MAITDSQRIFERSAKVLGDYQLLSKNDLANGYCDADEKGNQILRDAYFSALMLRYWYKIYDWAKSSQSLGLEIEDFVGWLVDCLNDAFYYRSWRYEYQAVVRNGKFIEWKLDDDGNKIKNEHYYLVDGAAVDRSINYFCSAKRGKEYQASNKDKRKSNALTYSLDQSNEETGDYALEKAGAVTEANVNNGLKDLIVYFLQQNKTIEALILDGIAFQDAFKENKEACYYTEIDEETGEESEEKYYKYSSDFDARKLVKHLSNISEKFMSDYFSIEYDISPLESEEIYNKLKGLSNTKLYKYIQKTLIEIKNNKNLLSFLTA